MQSDKPVVPISLWGPPMVRREQAINGDRYSFFQKGGVA